MAIKKLRESDLAKPVAGWLRSKGYIVYSEIPFWSRCIDMVGINDKDVCIVELKLRYSKKGFRQAYICQIATDNVYLAVGKKPSKKSIDFCGNYGIGLLVITDKVETILEPKKRIEVYYSAKNHLMENCLIAPPNDDAGKPCMSGNGPAQAVGSFVVDYIKQHPKAGWKEVYENIPNHYSSHKSMACAMSGYLKMPLYKIKQNM